MRRAPRGLRARIVLGFAVVTLLVSVVLAGTTFLLARSYLLDQREASLTRQAFADANLLNSRLATAGAEVRRYRKPTFTKPAPVDLRQQIAVECGAVIEALAD